MQLVTWPVQLPLPLGLGGAVGEHPARWQKQQHVTAVGAMASTAAALPWAWLCSWGTPCKMAEATTSECSWCAGQYAAQPSAMLHSKTAASVAWAWLGGQGHGGVM
jgi:hypothetical protein